MTDLFRVLALLGVLAGPLPLVAAWRRRSSLTGGGVTAALAAILAWTGLQIGLAQALGMVGALRLAPLLAAEAALAAAGAGLLWRGRATQGVAARGAATKAADAAASAAAEGDSWLGPSLVLGALLPIAACSLWTVLAVPTGNHDSLSYHLPSLAQWLQTGRFDEVRFLGPPRYYGYGWEMLSALTMLPLGQDLAVALPNLLGWALLGLSARALARSLGAPRLGAAVAAVLVMLLPVVLGRMDACQPDLAIAAVFAAGLHFAWRAARERDPGAWPFALTAIAILPALKLSGLVYAGLLALAFAWAWLSGPRERWRPRRGPALALLAGLVFVAGFWYARNLVLTGNPLAVVSVEMGGRTFLEGESGAAQIQRTTLAAVFDPAQAGDWATLGGILRQGLGLPMLGIVALALVGAVERGLARRRGGARRASRFGGAWLGSLALLAAVAYVLTPYGGDNGNHGYRLTPWAEVGLRYANSLWTLLGVAAAALYPRGAARWIGVALAPLAAASALHAAFSAPWALAGALALGGAGLAAAAGWAWRSARRRDPRRRRAPGGAAGAALLVGLLLGVLLVAASPERARQRLEIYGEPFANLERDVGPREPIAFLAVTRPFMLCGSRLGRPVLAPDHAAGSLDRWRRQRGEWLWDVGAWIDGLPDRGARFLVVGEPDKEGFSDRRSEPARGLMEERRGRWELVWRTDGRNSLRLYRSVQP